MAPGMEPVRLYQLCLEQICPLLEKQGAKLDWSNDQCPGPLDNLARAITEDLLLHATCGAKQWKNSWIIFLTPKITSAVLKWEKCVLEYVGARCKNLRRVLFKWVVDNFDPTFLKHFPKAVSSVDFDGELYYRGKLVLPEFGQHSWLPESESILKAISLSKKKPSSSGSYLVELHLGTMTVSADQLITVLQLAPNLKLLRHYQLVSALYKQHAEEWKGNCSLPKYKLNNLDADFSHVVRCRMSPQAVLAGDAMKLATQLCPDVSSVRVRIDCSTPHDVLAPLTGATRVKVLGA